MDVFLQQVINGFTLGSIYGLIALGYTMVYGILFMINFAHSEIFMIGAYIVLGIFLLLSVVFPVVGFSLIISVLIASVLVGLLGVGVEKVAYKPLRNSPRLAPLISAISVSLILQNLVFIFISSNIIPYTAISDKIPSSKILGFDFKSLLIIAITVLLMSSLGVFITKTKLGIAIRATSQDSRTTRLMGINSDNIISLVFFIGAFLGAVGGFFYGTYYSTIRYDMGFFPGIKSFTAAVVGGIGNIPGAVIGGLIIGMLEVMVDGYISSTYRDVIVFSILILTLLLKPEGILGEKYIEKI